MNVHYQTASAAAELEQLALERTGHRLAGQQLATLDHKRVHSELTTSYFANDRTWRMIQRSDEGPTTSEMVWHLQGILMKKDLPPFDAAIRPNMKAKARYLRQGVTIGGFSTPTFSRAAENISEIYSVFSRCVKEGSLAPSDVVTTSPNGVSISASNRYFTSRSDDPQGQAYTIGFDIDPNGTLTQVAGDRYFYGEDNIVYYLEKIENTETGTGNASLQSKSIGPVKIREGDIVEIQVTFMLVPMKGNKWRMNAVLRCITILDASFALEATRRLSTNAPLEVLEPQVRLKRRIGKDIEDEQQEDARSNKFQRMNVDG
ncbi:hypothetical protein CC1G_04150 [Coprinopsis cinerea okayama7|uniref:Uncharacterized protein n=1 Tax=Coprinopsis cinerea (strain Okayama-7 / 130 / ATCC MYA-4618 / FGSC 9003) TaxID=240176 RepID=A8NW60_COPC7|nr:hypothetical protein CC1G_04150 [Coprinopsis cinerea okayama7\|eukprot:XP_001836837.2 hypothetical protein CC1G_04150 [Coprinopsis cinerea okayama7\